MEQNSPLRYEGHVDDLRAGWVRGWVWLPARPEEAVSVELVDAVGSVVAETGALLFRADLEQAGKRRGRCGFELVVPALAGGPFVLRARLSLAEGAGLVLATGIEAAPAEPVGAEPQRLSSSTGVVGWLDRADAEGLSGWCHPAKPFTTPVTLELVERDRVLATAVAAQWRNDLEDFRQGDGRCGFRLQPPDNLYDGEAHQLALRLPGGEPLMRAPVVVRLPAQSPPRPAPRPEPARPPADETPVFSILVNFYNMQREAGRTLLSLSRRFQQGVESLAYEVLCIDNGSEPPLQAEFIASFGPEFRLVRPSVVEKSPCRALNEAAAQARGRWLAVMIDGAHLLSPGVLREAHTALTVQPDAIVSLRQWFVGGDQRWFSVAGYSRAHEDVLYARIDWPHDGYRLFDISSPMYESPNSWLDGMSESNCLFVPADLYRRIGGLDPAFDIPGAGFANLDLFRRASEAAGAVVGLIGEASFHQYHGGVTTNVDDAEKDSRVRAYASRYEELRGGGFVNVAPKDIRLSGSIRTGLALTGRQRPFCPANLGVTSRVRPRPASIQFDEEAQRYLQSAYVETGRHLETRWRGLQVGVAPSDLVDIQEVLWRVRPERLVLCGVSAGLAAYAASILQGLDLAATSLVWITTEPQEVLQGVEQIVGALSSPATLDRVAAAVGDAEQVVVLLQPAPDDALPIPTLDAYARFVTFGGYLVVLGTALGQPWLGYSRSWLYRAIVRFTQARTDFVIDRTLTRHFVTTCPSGFLRRALEPLSLGLYDEALDDLSGV